GWRHLRFLLVHSPTHLFVLPGLVLSVVGLLIALVSVSNVEVFGRQWQLHTTVGGSMLMIVGVQVVALGLCAHAYGSYFMGEKDAWFDRMRARFRLEHGLLLGAASATVGLITGIVILGMWVNSGFGSLSEERLAILATTMVVIGLQTVFSSFLLSILGLRRHAA
ncbi:MAG: glycosyl transferase family 2, partial [Conexibacter sp.]|nr:glycosyl transferase family 2 [Conexibacter sp.]